MRLIKLYREKIKQRERLNSEIESIERDPEFGSSMEFTHRLDDLLEEYGMTLEEAICILDPSVGLKLSLATSQREAAAPVLYTNPHTGESVSYRGQQNQILNAWKQQYGAKVVRDWAERK